MKKIVLLLLPLSIFAQSYEVLFLGNSYTYSNNMPNMASQIATSLGDTLLVEMNAPGGWKLEQHAANNSSSIQKIQEKNWDYVVLQAQSNEPSFPPSQVEQETYPFAQILVDSIESNYSCTEPIFFMTWGRKNGDNINGQFYPIISTYLGMQQRLRESYLEMGIDNDATVAPVGMAWKESINTNPNFELYTNDESHPNIAGSYLTACVFYCTIFQESCLGASFFPSALSSDEAATLQSIASAVVLDSTQVWNMFAIQSVDTTQSSTNTYEFNVQASNYEGLEWDFGDGTTDDNPNTTHSFTNTQNTVTLSLFTNDSCLVKNYTFDINTTTNINTYDPKDDRGIQIYPNPISHELNIEVLNESRVRIFNALGKLVFDKNVKGHQRLNFENQPNGYYMIQISNEQGFVSHKMIKI